MSNGYEQIYRGLLPRLAQCDLAESAGRLGLQLLANGDVAIQFCGREYLINSAGVIPADSQPDDVNFRNVLAYYILSTGSGEPEHSFVPLPRTTGIIDGQKIHDKGMLILPLLREFGGDYDKLQSAAQNIGGVLEDSSPDGGHCWTFQVLPKIPLRLIFYEADDEFPADIQILFDRSAPRFMAFECLAFLTGCFAKSLVRAAGLPAIPLPEAKVKA
jgi:hypothetical protein